MPTNAKLSTRGNKKMKFKGYGAGVEIYEQGSQYIDEHGHPVEQAQLRYGLNVEAKNTAWGWHFVCQEAGQDQPGFAPESLIKQAIPEAEREEDPCPYCGSIEIRPVHVGGQIKTCATCGGSW